MLHVIPCARSAQCAKADRLTQIITCPTLACMFLLRTRFLWMESSDHTFLMRRLGCHCVTVTLIPGPGPATRVTLGILAAIGVTSHRRRPNVTVTVMARPPGGPGPGGLQDS